MSEAPEWMTRLASACVESVPGEVARGEQVRRPPARAADARDSAVLMLMGTRAGAGPDVLLIRRAATLRDHAGQVAFPGGRVEPGDAGPIDTALREAAEETGVDPAGVDPLLTLPPLHIPRSGFAVTPVLAWWRDPVEVGVRDRVEVAAVARVPLATLADPLSRATVVGPSGYRGPCFDLPGMFVWGFTAMLLDRLLDLGGFALGWDVGRELPLPAAVAGRLSEGVA